MSFPESRPYLLATCVSYFVMSTFVQVLTMYVEGETVFRSQALSSGKVLHIRSILNDLEATYEFFVLYDVADKMGVQTSELKPAFSCYIGDYFTERGDFWGKGFKGLVRQHLPSDVTCVDIYATSGKRK